ncbi:MAG: hypothetical protein CYG59_26400 [Chloroflexi bacterium]|nr:MAG: hypothetical protein CYG59_26400 [Chloroflexota bacterium]
MVRGLPLQAGTHPRAKFNQMGRRPNLHWLDIAGVGPPIAPDGRQLRDTTASCVPGRDPHRYKRWFSCQSGDSAGAIMLGRRRAEVHVGHVISYPKGSFDITPAYQRQTRLPQRCSRMLHQQDRYALTPGGGTASPACIVGMPRRCACETLMTQPVVA